MVCCAILCRALFTQGSSETAAESLLTLDDASALTAAERLVQKLAKLSTGSNGKVAEAAGTDKQATAAAAAAAADAMDVDQPQQQQQEQGGKEHQLLLGRRLLQVGSVAWLNTAVDENKGFVPLQTDRRRKVPMGRLRRRWKDLDAADGTAQPA
jgi:hypothetical protein